MTTDRTTKALLAVIALALSGIAARDLGLVGPADLDLVGPATAGFGEGQKVIVTNYKTSGTAYGDILYVHCTNCK